MTTMHVEDGALVRYLDEECDGDEQAAVRGHVEACGACAGRLAELARRARALRVALRAADRPARAAPSAPRWGLRAAAAVLVLLAIGGAVRPVRAWVLDRAEALWTALTGGVEPPPLAPVGLVPPVQTAVSFVPAQGTFTIELAGRQAAGVLALEGVPGDTARATVLGGGGAESLVVLPAGLRIVNPPASAARYRIALPARLGPVRVIVGGAAPRLFDPAGPPVEIDLGGR
jgi:anti-sigma factor RsiW